MTFVHTEFAYLCHLVRERSAIVISDDKAYLAESRLQPLARELGLPSADALIEKVRVTRDRRLEDRVVEAMTTNETLWFRDVHPFTALRQAVLPEIAARKGTSRELSVWSAACSSGQELYSIAMVIADDFPDLLSWRLRLDGTDLSTEMVRRARAGRYSTLEVNRGLPATSLARHFSHDDDNRFTIRDELRRLAAFRRMNLAAAWGPLPRYDVIFVRNVLIYFDMATRRGILESVARCIDPNGYLFIGSTESLMGVSDAFETTTSDGTTFYRMKRRP